MEFRRFTPEERDQWMTPSVIALIPFVILAIIVGGWLGYLIAVGGGSLIAVALQWLVQR